MLKNIFQHLFRPTIPPVVAIVVLVAVVLLTWSITVRDSHQKRLASLGTAPMNTEVYTDLASLRVESVREDNVGALPFVPREGYTFIIPTLVIKNLSSTTRDLIPTIAFYIKDADGNLYNMAVAPLNTEQFGGPMLPHDTVRQEMAFEVKESARDLVMYFETGGKVMTERLSE